MSAILSQISQLFSGDAQAGRVVPPSGFTANLTLFASAAMAFLAVFVLAFSVATGRLAERWGGELARSSTIRISAPQGQMAAQTEAALSILSTTRGVKSARALSMDEQRQLLEPWFGPDIPLDTLPVPQLIEVVEDAQGFDADGLRLRLAGEVPGAVLDDHTRWRQPLVRAAGRMRLLGWLSLVLIAATMGTMITLAAQAALAANKQVIAVLRLVGATDGYIAQAFVRRFTLRSLIGAGVGMLVGLLLLWILPTARIESGFLTGLGFQGVSWFLPFVIPPLSALVAFAATRAAANRTLRNLS